MSKMNAYDEVISGRVTARDKKLMKDSGYRVRDAISFFLNHSCHPKKKLMVDKFFVSNKIEELKAERDNIELEIISAERHLAEINNQLGIVEVNGHEYSFEINQAVDIIIQRFEMYHGPLDDFFQTAKYKHIIENQEALLHLDDGEIKELVKEKVSKQV